MKKHEDKAKALGKIPSGLLVVAVDEGGGKIEGYLASWVQQASFEPLIVAVAMKAERSGVNAILEKKVFTLNIVSQENQQLMKPFWNGYSENENPFNHLSQSRGENGGVILEDSSAVMECRLVREVTPGDHIIVFAEVLESYVNKEEQSTLIHMRNSGATY